jgi:hypothetical protein
VKREQRLSFHPHLASPVKGEEQRHDCKDCLKLIRMECRGKRPPTGGIRGDLLLHVHQAVYEGQPPAPHNPPTPSPLSPLPSPPPEGSGVGGGVGGLLIRGIKGDCVASRTETDALQIYGFAVKTHDIIDTCNMTNKASIVVTIVNSSRISFIDGCVHVIRIFDYFCDFHRIDLP